MKGHQVADMKPMDIEKKSMEIIERELTAPLSEETKPIVMRVIHATADFSFSENIRTTPGAVGLMREMLKSGATVMTDTNMALSGINRAAAKKLGLTLLCLMADEDVAAEAKARGITRAAVSMERGLTIPGQKIFVCGNAPTFLFPLMKAAPQSGVAAIGVPVGFVNVVEAKEMLWESGIPSIVAMGRRGGSNVAAAIVNALMYGIEGVR